MLGVGAAWFGIGGIACAATACGAYPGGAPVPGKPGGGASAISWTRVVALCAQAGELCVPKLGLQAPTPREPPPAAERPLVRRQNQTD